jgi:hypothetical protein
MGLKPLGREAGHSSPPRAEVKIGRATPPLLAYASVAQLLSKNRHNLSFLTLNFLSGGYVERYAKIIYYES